MACKLQWKPSLKVASIKTRRHQARAIHFKVRPKQERFMRTRAHTMRVVVFKHTTKHLFVSLPQEHSEHASAFKARPVHHGGFLVFWGSLISHDVRHDIPSYIAATAHTPVWWTSGRVQITSNAGVRRGKTKQRTKRCPGDMRLAACGCSGRD